MLKHLSFLVAISALSIGSSNANGGLWSQYNAWPPEQDNNIPGLPPITASVLPARAIRAPAAALRPANFEKNHGLIRVPLTRDQQPMEPHSGSRALNIGDGMYSYANRALYGKAFISGNRALFNGPADPDHRFVANRPLNGKGDHLLGSRALYRDEKVSANHAVSHNRKCHIANRAMPSNNIYLLNENEEHKFGKHRLHRKVKAIGNRALYTPVGRHY